MSHNVKAEGINSVQSAFLACNLHLNNVKLTADNENDLHLTQLVISELFFPPLALALPFTPARDLFSVPPPRGREIKFITCTIIIFIVNCFRPQTAGCHFAVGRFFRAGPSARSRCLARARNLAPESEKRAKSDAKTGPNEQRRGKYERKTHRKNFG